MKRLIWSGAVVGVLLAWGSYAAAAAPAGPRLIRQFGHMLDESYADLHAGMHR